jgi:hypothetical protein
VFEKRIIVEGKRLGVRFQKKVERVIDHHVGHKIDFHLKFTNWFGVDDPCQIVAVRILLPVQKIAFGLDLESVTENGCPTVRGRPQPDDVGAHMNGAVVAIMGLVIECDVERHKDSTAHQEGCDIE